MNIYASHVVTVDELMSSWTGKLMPHLSFVKRKPEPLGCEMKCIACGTSGVMLAIEIQEGKEAMAEKQHTSDWQKTTATVRLCEQAGLFGSQRIVIGDWFASYQTCKALEVLGSISLEMLRRRIDYSLAWPCSNSSQVQSEVCWFIPRLLDRSRRQSSPGSIQRSRLKRIR
jgi:hypothetical protein